MNKSTLSSKTLSHWHQVFRFLSLDCALPLWEQMGLNVNEDDKLFVKYAARVAYLIVQDGANNYYDANYSKIKEGKTIFSTCLKKYRNGNLAMNMLAWCKHDFVQEEKQYMTVEKAWSIAFGRLKKDYPNISCSLELPSEKINWLLDRVTELYVFEKRLQDFIETATRGNKSKWDQAIYEGSFAPEWDHGKIEGEDTFYALLDASNTIEKKVINKMIANIWRDIVKEFGSAHVDQLFEWYQCLMEDSIKMFPGVLEKPQTS
jgi:hypothetical protein